METQGFFDRDDGQTGEMPRLIDQALAFTSCGVTVADMRRRDMPLVYVNQAFEEITGYAAHEVLGRNCRYLQGKDSEQAGTRTIRRALKEGRHCEVLLRNYRKSGALFWNELILSPIFDDQGALTHFVGIQSDVSARENARREHRRLVDELENLNHELEDQARLVAQQMEGPFAELRRIGSALLAEPQPGANVEWQTLAAALSERTEQLERIASRLLEYTAIAPFRGVFKPVRLDLLLCDVLGTIERPDGVGIQCPRPLPALHSCRAWLEIIFRELIDNAVRHRAAPAGSVVIGWQENSGWRRFWVSDDGSGIRREDQKRIFELFETGAGRTSAGGMGLNLARRAAEALGGRLWLGSIPRRGSVFFVQLPR